MQHWFFVAAMAVGPAAWASPTLDAGAWLPDHNLDLTVTDAPPGARVVFFRSTVGPGPGPCNAAGLCADVLSPVLAGRANADASGVATLRLRSVRGVEEVWFQAMVLDPAGAVATQVVDRVAGDADLNGTADLWISAVSLFQVLEVPLLDASGPVLTRDLPIIAGRDGVVCVTVGSAEPAPVRVEAEVYFDDGASVVSSFGWTQAPAGGERPVCARFLGADVDLDTILYVDLRVAGAHTALERWPSAGGMPLEPVDPGPLVLEYVPMSYDADGSGRLPDLSPTILDSYRDGMMALYPTNQVVSSVSARTLSLARRLNSSGAWSDELDRFTQATSAWGVPVTTRLIGVFRDRNGVGIFGNPTGTVGIGTVGRVDGGAIVLQFERNTFRESEDLQTVRHEVGHTLSLLHDNCGGATGWDQTLPQNHAVVDRNGWDLRTGDFIEAGRRQEFMSYCRPSWIRPEYYAQLYNTLSSINHAPMPLPSMHPDAAWPITHAYHAIGTQVRVNVQQFTLPPASPGPLSGVLACVDDGVSAPICGTTGGDGDVLLQGERATHYDLRLTAPSYLTANTRLQTSLSAHAGGNLLLIPNQVAATLSAALGLPYPLANAGYLVVTMQVPATAHIVLDGGAQPPLYLASTGLPAADQRQANDATYALFAPLTPGPHTLTVTGATGTLACTFPVTGLYNRTTSDWNVRAGEMTTAWVGCEE